MSDLRLYGYWRSSAAYRVRIALNLKGLAYETVPVQLAEGEQRTAQYRRVNPQGLVPTLAHGTRLIAQSLAIMEYLEETHPEPRLLPADPAGRARVRALALNVACDIHPLNNLRVLKYLTAPLGVDEAARAHWYAHWIAAGFTALEEQLRRESATGRYCHGDEPGLADACLVPQVYNARRFECDLEPYPALMEIAQRCETLAAFRDAAPENQVDAPT